MLSSAWLYLLTVGPFGLYLWVLALWQSGRHPRVVRGLVDFAWLAFGVGGLVTFGPIGRFAAGFISRTPDWVDRLAIGSAFGLVACGMALRALNRFVVYQVDPEVLTRALDELLAQDGGRFVRTLGGYEDRSAGRALRVEVSPRLRCATVEATGEGASGLIARLRGRLRERFRAVPSRPSPVALLLYVGSVVVMLVPLLPALASQGRAREALRVFLERITG